eukprot:TRINITY_DN40728_c0_g1_i1.p1 TRINITY_DN40728_c0_g1~~TRINITY_DN40728_c0_g1_i1.p1  ORF type:complete len:332 (-),score=39.48 TRINITY_DN40728_c0_g1_i1:299-1294(-)
MMAMRMPWIWFSLQLPACFIHVAAESRDDAISEMLPWLLAQGADGFGNVVLSVFDKGANVSTRGLAVTRDVKKGDSIFLIPGNLSLHVGNPLLADLSQLGDIAEDADKLVLHLAYERSLGDKSVWSHYIRGMPKEDDYRVFHPAYAKTDLLETFSYLPVVQRLTKQANKLQRKYDKLGAKKVGISYDVFLWASVAYMSRTFGKEEWLPFCDLMNGDFKPSTKIYCDDYDECNIYEVFASRDLKAGDELTVTHGDLRNDRNLFYFGFLYNKNPTRAPALDLSVCSSAPVQKALSLDEHEQLPLVRSLQALTREQCDSKGRRGKGRSKRKQEL